MNIEKWLEDNVALDTYNEEFVIKLSDFQSLMETHAIVPREPSEKILAVGMDKVYGRFGTASSRTTDAYQAMIKASENE